MFVLVMLGHATSADRASENWAGLQNFYETKDIMNKCHPRKQYVNYSMKEGAIIKSHFHEFKLFLEQLASVGVKYNDDDNVETMLSSPPDSYVPMIMTLTPQPGETLQDVIAKLLTNDIHCKKNSEFIEGDGTTALWVARKLPFGKPLNKFSTASSSFFGMMTPSINQNIQAPQQPNLLPTKKEGCCNYSKKMGHYKEC
jgi:hypothetical protein